MVDTDDNAMDFTASLIELSNVVYPSLLFVSAAGTYPANASGCESVYFAYGNATMYISGEASFEMQPSG